MRTKMNWFFILMLVLITGKAILASRITISDNAYSNIVIAIGPSTPRSQSDAIIKNIKKMVLEASPVLYKATQDRAYFSSVRILVPESWTHVEANISSWETFETADVIIDAPNAAHGDVPYTRQLGGCGDLGEYIHMTPNYISTIEEEGNVIFFGKPGKVFVHEWAHLRYGIFDEYGEAGAGAEGYPLFFRRNGSKTIVPNICANKAPIYTTLDISDNGTCKIDPNTQLYDSNCRFYFNEQYKPDTSLASYHQLNSVEHFCRDDQAFMHNYDAPNKHNAMCGRRSAWTVISRSPDFAGDKNKPVDLNKLETEFTILRPAGSRFVLVADVSGSMILCKRIGKLGESVRSWIKNDLPVGSQLGMVQFSSFAHIVSELTTISDAESRMALMNQVPSALFSATCIGCGLALATKMLVEAGPGGTILLVTDGKNSPGYHDICDVQPDIIEAGIRVITIAFGSEADPNIEKLADLTDGKSYFVSDEDTSEALHEAFLGAMTYQSAISSSTDLQIKLFEAKTDSSADVLEGDFSVDFSVGRNLKLRVVNLEKKENVISIELNGPNGEKEDQFEFEGTTASVQIEMAEVGDWNFKIELNKDRPSTPLLVVATSQLLPDTSAPITTKCWVPNGADIQDAVNKPIRIHAQVWKGSNPVIGAVVRAYVEKPDEEFEILELLDNGVNADTVADDGVYSRFFTNVSLTGRYSVKCQVSDDGSAYVGLGFIGSANPLMLDDHGKPYYPSEQESGQDKMLTGNFNRVAAGGSFKVDIPVSSQDAYPPGTVTDLAVSIIGQTEVNGMNITVQLKWTAPGDELDTGTVARYEIRYSEDATRLFDSNFNSSDGSWVIAEEHVMSGSITPTKSGSIQTFDCFLPDAAADRPYFVALRAVNKAHKFGSVSNLAAFYFPNPQSSYEFDEGINLDKQNGGAEEMNADEVARMRDDFMVDLEEDIIHEFNSQLSAVALGFGSVLVLCLAGTVIWIVVKKIRRPDPYTMVSA